MHNQRDVDRFDGRADPVILPTSPRRRAARRWLVLVTIVAAVTVSVASTASAEVVGPCDGTAEWANGLMITASEIPAGAVVEIPRKATVEWAGAIAIEPPTESRDVSGRVRIGLPSPFGEITVADWSDGGTLVENSGTYEYEVPGILSGFEIPISVKHWEGTRTFSGAPTCEGDVIVKVTGTNPLGYVTGGFAIIALAGVYLSIKAKNPTGGVPA